MSELDDRLSIKQIKQKRRELHIFSAALLLLAVLVLAFSLFEPGIETHINPTLWTVGNLLVAASSLALAFYSLFYFFFFRWREYSASRSIMYFVSSLLGVILLIVVSVFLNPIEGQSWNDYPSDVFVWRPLARFIVYGALVLATTRLGVQLIQRYRRGLKLEIQAEPRKFQH